MSDALAVYARETIRAGSKSFAAAARLFDCDTRESATLLYAWCRRCDDVIDGQTLGHGQTSGDRGGADERLALLEDLTRRAYAGEAMTDPAFAAFQRVVRRHTIPVRHALDHLAGFRMDVDGRRYRALEDTLAYCYHVAGVVGVIMAMVMGVRDDDMLDRAADLGIAFQLSNIARDVVEDAAIGRVYLPETWLTEAGVAWDQVGERGQRAAVARVVARLLDVAETYYDSASAGIGALPWRSAWAIATARDVYRRVGRQVRARGAAAWDSRTVTTTVAKAASVATGLTHVALSRAQAGPARPNSLWTRPR